MAKATLTTLTPVHIGSGITYSKDIDFVRVGNQLGIIDEEKIFNLIGGADYISHWVNAIDNNKGIIQFLKERGQIIKNIEDVADRIINIKGSAESMQLKSHFRTSLKGLCIPGSSLKGAIKTAVWNNATTADFLDKVLVDELTDSRGYFSDKKLDRRFFGGDATEKSTRFLKIGDVHFNEVIPDAYEIRVLNKKRKEWSFMEGSMLFESIPIGCEAIFELKLDQMLMKRNIEKNDRLWPKEKTGFLQSIENICNQINELTQATIEWELKDLKSEMLGDSGDHMLDGYKDILNQIHGLNASNEFIIRVGGNSGWKFTTGGWAAMVGDQIEVSDYNSLRKKIQIKDYSTMPLWPKTRKITPDGVLFGFVKVKIHE